MQGIEIQLFAVGPGGGSDASESRDFSPRRTQDTIALLLSQQSLARLSDLSHTFARRVLLHKASNLEKQLILLGLAPEKNRNPTNILVI